MGDYRRKDKDGKEYETPSIPYFLYKMRGFEWLKTTDKFGDFFRCGLCTSAKQTYMSLQKELYRQLVQNSRNCKKYVCECGDCNDFQMTMNCEKLCHCENHTIEKEKFDKDFPGTLTKFIDRHLCQNKKNLVAAKKFTKSKCFTGKCKTCDFKQFKIEKI